MNDYAGTLTAFTRGGVTFHTYTAPEAGFRVNTHIVESAGSLTVIDAQLALPLAREVADVIAEMGKPVSRIIITHAHPDHFSGLQVLAEGLPGVPVLALQDVRDELTRVAQPMLDSRRAMFGDIVAERAVYPTETLATGLTRFDDLTIHVAQVEETENHAQALITFPDQRVLATSDMLFAPGHHMFANIGDPDAFTHWIDELQAIGRREDIDTLLTGHGPTTDLSAVAPAVEYLQFARTAYADSATAEAYAKALKEHYPKHHDPVWVDFISQLLYGHINP